MRHRRLKGIRDFIKRITLNPFIQIFTHLTLCLATATHNFKLLKIIIFA